MNPEEILKRMPRAAGYYIDCADEAGKVGIESQAQLCAQWIADNFVELPSEEAASHEIAKKWIGPLSIDDIRLLVTQLFDWLKERDGEK